MEKKNKFNVTSGNWTPTNHRGVYTKSEAPTSTT